MFLVRILIVEDQDSIRHMIRALVQARGYEVTAVESGARALEEATAAPPDVVLLDLMMPGDFDGLDVCRRLRLDPSTRRLPILIITAATDATSREEAMRAGATGFFTKPFSPFELLNELERLAPPTSPPPKA